MLFANHSINVSVSKNKPEHLGSYIDEAKRELKMLGFQASGIYFRRYSLKLSSQT